MRRNVSVYPQHLFFVLILTGMTVCLSVGNALGQAPGGNSGIRFNDPMQGARTLPGGTVTSIPPQTQPPGESIIQRVRAANERLEMIVNQSRILTLDKKIPQVVVNNDQMLQATALSPNQVQVFALAPGVTQVNLWDETGSVFTIDVTIHGDTRELANLLEQEFPTASLKLRAVSNGVLISGYVENSDHITRIISIAEEFYPQVVTNIQVGGVHQVLLHVKVIEISRTKLAQCGFNWWQSDTGFVGVNGGNGINALNWEKFPPVFGGTATLAFRAIDGGSSFYGILEALRQDNVAKILSEPTLVTYNGRPATFLAGGSVPVQSGGGLGVPASIQYRDYGTQINFVPIVLGNGRIRLEVNPVVSEIDQSRAVNGNPAFKVRRVDTGMEMKSGQTLAIAGLLQTLVEAEKRGIPFVSDVPYLGAMFRYTKQQENEVELLILVTPELVAAMDPEQVPQCFPGMDTTLPSEWDMFMKGHIEVPDCCSVCGGQGCAKCLKQAGPTAASAGREPGMIGGEPTMSGALQMEEIGGYQSPMTHSAQAMGSQPVGVMPWTNPQPMPRNNAPFEVAAPVAPPAAPASNFRPAPSMSAPVEPSGSNKQSPDEPGMARIQLGMQSPGENTAPVSPTRMRAFPSYPVHQPNALNQSHSPATVNAPVQPVAPSIAPAPGRPQDTPRSSDRQNDGLRNKLTSSFEFKRVTPRYTIGEDTNGEQMSRPARTETPSLATQPGGNQTSMNPSTGPQARDDYVIQTSARSTQTGPAGIIMLPPVDGPAIRPAGTTRSMSAPMPPMSDSEDSADTRSSAGLPGLQGPVGYELR